MACCIACCSKTDNRGSASSSPVKEHKSALAELSRETLPSEILETVFRYQFDHGDPNIPRTPRGSRYKAYYLGIVHDEDNGFAGFGFPAETLIQDPDAAFIDRFRNISPTVSKFSLCKRMGDGVTDRDTGQPGVLLVVGEVRWISKTELLVDAAYYFHAYFAATQTFHIRLEGDRFFITKVDTVMMS